MRCICINLAWSEADRGSKASLQVRTTLNFATPSCKPPPPLQNFKFSTRIQSRLVATKLYIVIVAKPYAWLQEPSRSQYRNLYQIS